MKSDNRGDAQTAYQILVAATKAELQASGSHLWDSGRVASNQTFAIPYTGKPLRSFQSVWWQVRTWDRAGTPSAWSAPASWTMGVLAQADWKASWIAAQTPSETLLLRREWTVKPGLRRALINVCGLGTCDLTVNGARIGKDFLSPGWTNYKQTCLYDTREVTAALHEGKNVIGLFLANDAYNVHRYQPARFTPPAYKPYSFGPLQAIAQLRLEYADGSVETVGTDSNWKTSAGPITTSSMYAGEDFDARLVQEGWDQPGFDDSHWQPASPSPGPGGVLRGHSVAAPPIRAFETLLPVAKKELDLGTTVYDFGQNAPLMPQLAVSGPAGSVVKIVPSELVKADGSIDDRVCGGKSDWTYTLAGKGLETWAPHFFYRGARYLQVICTAPAGGTELPVISSLQASVVHSAAGPIGEFSCSNELFNRIHTLVRWAQVSNLVSVVTDCPQREKRGWLEQDHLNGPSLRYEFDLNRLFAKTVNDIADSQLASGLVPTTAPEYTVFADKKAAPGARNAFGDSPEWSSAFLLVPQQQYEFTGDASLFARSYDGMKRYVDYLTTRATANVVDYGLGDWFDLGPKRPGVSQLTPIALTATAFYYEDCHLLAAAARRLGKTEDASHYEKLAADIRTAFNARFFDARKGGYATGSQAAQAIPLVMGLVTAENRDAVLKTLVADVMVKGNTAGDVGYRYVLRALAEGGRSELIYAMNNQSDKPGYGYQLAQGATSLTEAWDAGRQASQNHFMLGQIVEWFYHDLAGIAPDPSAPGFANVIIQPHPVGDLQRAKATYHSVRGPISVDWKRTGGAFALKLNIPANTTATVILPAPATQAISESGHPPGRSGRGETNPSRSREDRARRGIGELFFSGEVRQSLSGAS
ncbi:MAG: family 78 glycoside hydrolase catalytic domain [Chthoniobacteraceae bacterium]